MGTFLAPETGSVADRPETGTALLGSARPVGLCGFTGGAVASLGGPLALAALHAPSITAGASTSAGLAGVMIAGRRAALLVIGLIAAGQLAIAAALGGVTLSGLTTPAHTFGGSAPAGSLAIASAQTALLVICGSLPFFMGGEFGGGVPRACAACNDGAQVSSVTGVAGASSGVLRSRSPLRARDAGEGSGHVDHGLG